MTEAADLYEQAARPAHRRTPQATAAGQHLRSAAGALLAVRRTLPSETRQVLALLAQLQSLAATVASLRDAQGRAAQAAAAWTAVEHLAVVVGRQAESPPSATVVDLLSAPSRVTAPGRGHRSSARTIGVGVARLRHRADANMAVDNFVLSLRVGLGHATFGA